MLVPNPATGTSSGRFYSHADSVPDETLVRREGPLERWGGSEDDGGELDDSIRRERALEKKHIAVREITGLAVIARWHLWLVREN